MIFQRPESFILAKAKLSKGRTLEVGTGKGHLAIVLAKKGFRFISIDLDRKAQGVAKKVLKELKLDKLATLKIMDAEKTALSR